MNFSDLTFVDHAIDGAVVALHTFPNNWTVSVVTGPEGCGLYGNINADTFEVGIIRPDNEMLEDVMPYQTPVQVTTILRLVSML